jgi:hypothetical protein
MSVVDADDNPPLSPFETLGDIKGALTAAIHSPCGPVKPEGDQSAINPAVEMSGNLPAGDGRAISEDGTEELAMVGKKSGKNRKKKKAKSKNRASVSE